MDVQYWFKPLVLLNFGLSIFSRFEVLGIKLIWPVQYCSFRQLRALAQVLRPLRLHAYLLWASSARHTSILDTYTVALEPLPQLIWLGLALTIRWQEIIQKIRSSFAQDDHTVFCCHPVRTAFLSTSDTATDDKALSEEAIHLAAGMLLAGYGGVVATMWSIKNSDAPLVADKVYGLFQNLDGHPDYRNTSRALHDAVRGLQSSG